MTSIFENAKFGDKFRTRAGRMAIYQNGNDEFHHLFLSSCDILVDSYGYLNCKEFPSGLDIVSEWQEPINEEELDKLAVDDIFKVLNSDYFDGKISFNKLKEIYKAGYRKAMEGVV